MESRNGRNARRSKLSQALTLCFALSAASLASAADFKSGSVEWRLETGMDRAAFGEAFKRLDKEGFRIADIESYRSGRSTSVTTVWTKLAADERWAVELSLPIRDFLAAHDEHTKKGFSLVEFEADRTGATLHFSGIWLLTPKPMETEFYFGMEGLEFSNRYGEMADRGYRMIDFEVYEANGKFRHAAIWMKNDGKEVRFYRAIPKNRVNDFIVAMRDQGFRVVDFEGYMFEGRFVYACQWVKLAPNEEAEFAYDLSAGEFYNRNATHSSNGYRLTEFEVYEDRGTMYYAGSWLKTNAGAVKPAAPEAPAKRMSLEAFRSEE